MVPFRNLPPWTPQPVPAAGPKPRRVLKPQYLFGSLRPGAALLSRAPLNQAGAEIASLYLYRAAFLE